MKGTLTALLFTGGVLMSSMTFAGSLESNMKTLQKNYKVLSSAKDTNTALTALAQMKQASNASKTMLPMELESNPINSPEVKQYQSMYDQLNAQIDRATALAKAGKLAEAKQVAKSIDTIKKQGHAQYR